MKKLLSSFLVAAQLALLALLPSGIPARANVPCTVPFNLQNGTTADASQVMANYNAILTCLTNAAAAGVNSDITQLLGLTTPFSPSQGGTPVFIGGTSTGSANAQVIAAPTPSNFSLTTNYQIVFKAGFTNTGAMTLTVGSTATANLFKQSTSGPVALTGSEIQAGQIVFAWYDGTQFEMLPPVAVIAGFGIVVSGASGNTVSISTTAPPYGFDQPVNLSLGVSVNTPSANLLQVCVLTAAGATPSAASPVLIPVTNGVGGVNWLAVTSQLCMNTNAAGATLGSQNSTPFRLWIEAFNNTGTPVLALYNASCTTCGPSNFAEVFPLDETSAPATTAISTAAKSAGVFYTPNGTALGGNNFKILGYVEWASGLATAGSYASSASKAQLFGPGVKKAGDTVQTSYGTSITPTSTINFIKVFALVRGNCTAGSSAQSGITLGVQRPNGSTIVSSGNVNFEGLASVIVATTWNFNYFDTPGTTSQITYNGVIVTSVNCGGGTSVQNNFFPILEEVQG